MRGTALYLVAAFIVLMCLAVLIIKSSTKVTQKQTECEAKGGVFFTAHGASICIDRKAVIL